MQYTPPGGPEAKPQDRQAALEKEVEDARYHLGAIRIAPWFAIRDGAYVRNLFSTGTEPPADFTITVGAGLRGYLRNGTKLTWKIEALPEYLYWQKQSDRRRVNGRYRLGLFGYFNRLTVEAQAGRTQEQSIQTPEIPVPATARVDSQQLLTEVEISSLLRPYALLTLSQSRNLVDPEVDARTGALRTLDRKESVLRVGIRLRPSRSWRIGLGAERSQVDFDRATSDRSNEGTSPVLETRFERHRLLVEGDIAFRSLKARSGGQFVAYDRPTGNLLVTLRLAQKTSVAVYGDRALVYSLSRDYSYLEDNRIGTALMFELGRRMTSRFFYESGTNDYTPLSAAAPARSEKYSSYGTSLNFSLSPNVSLGINALSARFDSNLPGGDRTYSTVGATVNFGTK